VWGTSEKKILPTYAIGRTPQLRIDNFFILLVQTYDDDDDDLVVITTWMIGKL
jgi:hypothetical protein